MIKTIPNTLKRNGTEYFLRSNEIFCIINLVLDNYKSTIFNFMGVKAIVFFNNQSKL